MLQIPTKTKPAYNAGNILTLNQKSQCLASKHSTPQLRNLIQKGQKVRIGMVGQLPRLRVALGWNVSNLQCDIDLSAYLLDASGKVPGDDWFVFYGQTSSPNKSVTLHINESSSDREYADKTGASLPKKKSYLVNESAFSRWLNEKGFKIVDVQEEAVIERTVYIQKK